MEQLNNAAANDTVPGPQNDAVQAAAQRTPAPQNNAVQAAFSQNDDEPQAAAEQNAAAIPEACGTEPELRRKGRKNRQDCSKITIPTPKSGFLFYVGLVSAVYNAFINAGIVAKVNMPWWVGAIGVALSAMLVYCNGKKPKTDGSSMGYEE